MNARFFYAAPIFTNAPKLVVLTEDQVLYSEHKEFDVIKIDRVTDVNYSKFTEAEFESEEYPVLLEINYKEAREMPLYGQVNWIDRYVSSHNIDTKMAMQA